MAAPEADTYDYIVTGAGSAGCVVAARLSESGRYRVLLLEAGPRDTNPWIHIPLGFAKTYVHPTLNWRFESAPQPQLAGRTLYLPRGKTLGGSSSINGMVCMRGHHGDYDEWRQRGCEGWDWDSVLPYFKKAENQTRGADEFHGVGGPLHIRFRANRTRLRRNNRGRYRDTSIQVEDVNETDAERNGDVPSTMKVVRRISAVTWQRSTRVLITHLVDRCRLGPCGGGW